MAKKQETMTYYRGTTAAWTVNYDNQDTGVPGSSALFTVKAPPGYDADTLDANAIVKHEISLTDNTGNLVIAPGDISDSTLPGNYSFDVKVIDNNGAIYAIASGTFVLIATPTNRLS